MMMDVADGIQTFGFIPPEMPPGTRRLREQVSEFL
jgi:hypothetical protein